MSFSFWQRPTSVQSTCDPKFRGNDRRAAVNLSLTVSGNGALRPCHSLYAHTPSQLHLVLVCMHILAEANEALPFASELQKKTRIAESAQVKYLQRKFVQISPWRSQVISQLFSKYQKPSDFQCAEGSYFYMQVCGALASGVARLKSLPF